MSNVKLKILVACHKPSVLPKEEYFCPIHVGRSVCDRTNKDYEYMKMHMIGDDTGENISELNPYFCEMTALYWAWKNYDKLGNPEYIGLCHYRRYFKYDFLDKSINFDILAVNAPAGKKTIQEQFKCIHKTDLLENICAKIEQTQPEYIPIIKSYLNSKNGYYYNMFVMKKDLFFEYCSWIFPILLHWHKTFDYENTTAYNKRMPGFIAERLTGIFIEAKKKEGKIVTDVSEIFKKNTDLPALIEPLSACNSIPIVLASDQNYVPYLATTIQSIIENSSKNNFYDLIVLESGISQSEQKRIYSLISKENISVRFINMMPYVEIMNKDLLYTTGHISPATYFRLWIPEILLKYDKVLYLDTDCIVQRDIAELYNSLKFKKDTYLAASYDIEAQRMIWTSDFGTYLQEKLKLKNPKTYFQAGVLGFNLSAMREYKIKEKALKLLQEIKQPRYWDQDILNKVCEEHVMFFDNAWNLDWHLEFQTDNLLAELPLKFYEIYKKALEQPHIVHFAGMWKPWRNPSLPQAEYFWHYARSTPFYEQIIYENLTQKLNESYLGNIYGILNYKKDVIQYLKNKIFACILMGKLKWKKRLKSRALKSRLKYTKKLIEKAKTNFKTVDHG